LGDDEIRRIQVSGSHSEWSTFDTALLRSVDELIDDHMISDRTWQTLMERYDDRQLIEVPLVVGMYFSLGFALNSWGVRLEPDLA
jgi:transglutaminase/protease-like cytokinesis protein 3